MQTGAITLNEVRSEAGRSLIESPEADMPIVVVGSSAYFITPNGAIPFESSQTMDSEGEVETPEVEAPKEKPEIEAPDTQAVKEMKAFLRWLRKSPDREFKFEHVEVLYGDVLNKFIGEQDYDSARWYAERYLS